MTTSQVSTVIADPASVDAAIESRFSARAFLPRPVAREVLTRFVAQGPTPAELRAQVDRARALDIVGNPGGLGTSACPFGRQRPPGVNDRR